MTCFLHTADWQIGRQYSQFLPEDSNSISEARIDAVATIAKLAPPALRTTVQRSFLEAAATYV